MSRIEELREPVRPIAEKCKRWGFTVIDVTSIGLLLLKDWDPNTLSIYRELLVESGKDADSVVSEAEAYLKELKRKKGPPPSKAV